MTNETPESVQKEISVILRQINAPVRDAERIEELVSFFAASIKQYDNRLRQAQEKLKQMEKKDGSSDNN